MAHDCSKATEIEDLKYAVFGRNGDLGLVKLTERQIVVQQNINESLKDLKTTVSALTIFMTEQKAISEHKSTNRSEIAAWIVAGCSVGSLITALIIIL